MLSKDEVRFLAVLVQKGHLRKEDAEALLRDAQGGAAGATTLDELVARRGLIDPRKLAFLRSTHGEDVPAVPGYRYVQRAGVGGTAVVLEAVEEKTGRPVAVKVMHRPLLADARQRRRFVREARLLTDLAHENIVRGLRVGHVKDETGTERLVFVMEWVPGQTLLQLLRQGMQFGEDAALYIVLQAGKALQYLHGKGILHRDVKPDNILLTRDNTVKLIDLGFATALGEDEGSASDTTLGTAAYMSPEQARGTGDLDVRSDIYSLGATLYQIVVGELPFAGEGTQEQLAARILEALSSPELQSRRISPHMNYFIRKMMEQDRAFRYQSMDELLANIEEQIRGKKTLTWRENPAGEDELLDRPYQPDDGDAREPRDPRDARDPRDEGEPPRFPARRRRR
jgi:serine/threonine-protein kinase